MPLLEEDCNEKKGALWAGARCGGSPDGFRGGSSRTALAAAAEGDFKITVADNKVTITQYVGAGGNVVIPDTIGGVPVTAIAKNAFKSNIAITSIRLPANLVSIGEYAFYECTNLGEIEFNEGLVTTGERAFDSCSSLKEIILPSSIQVLGSQLFRNCTSVTKVYIPKSLNDDVPMKPFTGCTALRTVEFEKGIKRIPGYKTNYHGGIFCESGIVEIVLPDTVESIGINAFLDCKNLQKVKFSQGLKTIEERAFRNCSALEEAILPEGLQTLGRESFEGCTSLKEIFLPSTLKSAGWRSFYESTSLKTVTFEEGTQKIFGADPIYKDDGLFGNSGIKEIVIPESVTEIEGCAFAGCHELKSISLPSGITDIGAKSFYHCEALTELTLPEELTKIADSTFTGCSALASCPIPGKVGKIGKEAFLDCTSLQEVYVPKSVTAISDKAFMGCTALQSVEFEVHNLYTTVQTLGNSIFENCASLTDIQLGNRITAIPSSAFAGCTALKEIQIPHGVTKIPAGAFSKCNNLEILFVPKSVTTFNTTDTEFERSYNHVPLVYVEKGNATTASVCAKSLGWDVKVGIWNVDYTDAANEFPDKAFNDQLHEKRVDYNIDTRLTLREIEATASLAVPELGIADVTGLQLLTSLTKLDMSGNEIATFDTADGTPTLAALTGLAEFTCAGNRVALLDLSANTELVKLDISGNAILAIDLDANTKLVDVTLGEQEGSGTITASDYFPNLLALESIYGKQYKGASVSDLRDEYLAEGEEATAQEEGIAWQSAYAVPDRFAYDYGVTYGLGAETKMVVRVTLTNAGVEVTQDEFAESYPDGGFRTKISAALDTNRNGRVSRTEERSAKVLDVAGMGIKDLTGIARLWNLEELNCAGNKLSELSLAGNKGLTRLDVSGNDLKKLDLSGNTALTELNCEDNDLTGLDLSGNVRLVSVKCGNNALAALDITGLTELRTLRAGSQQVNVGGQLVGEVLTANISEYDSSFAKASVKSAEARDAMGNRIFGEVTVTDTGFVAPASAGQVVYVWTFGNGQPDMTVTAVVGDAYRLDVWELDLVVGETARLTAYYGKRELTGGVEWVSGDKAVVTADARGNIKGLGAGSTVVTATISDGSGSVTLTCAVTVSESTIALLDAEGKALFDPVIKVYGEVIGELPVPEREGYLFLGWYTGRNGDGERVEESTVLTDQRTLYAHLVEYTPGQLVVANIGSFVYTGARVKPAVNVYDGNRLLAEGLDYTVVYRHNVDAGENTAVAVVKGKGDYTGTTEAHFTILPKPLSDEDILVIGDGLTVTANGSAQKPIPRLVWGTRTLVSGTDYTTVWDDPGSYTEAGSYVITVKAASNNNFTGTRRVAMTILDTSDGSADAGKTLITGAKVSGIKAQVYKGVPAEPVPTAVKLGSKLLVYNTDYELDYANNDAVGTASVRIIGKGSYAGTKTVTFKLTGTPMSKTTVTGLGGQVWDGTAKKPAPVITVKGEGTVLTPGKDYTVSYSNNVAAGTAIMTVKGRGRMTGTVKKKFKIAAYDIGNGESAQTFIAVDAARDSGTGNIVAPWERSGARPVLSVSAGGVELLAGTDYTVKYYDNTTVGGTGKAVITGKRNLRGTKTVEFTVTKGDLGTATGIAKDVVRAGKAGRWLSKVVFKDSAGKKLVAGRDYERELAYTYLSVPEGAAVAAGSTPQPTDDPPVGTEISVKAIGLAGSGYEGTEKVVSYRIVSADIAKAGIVVKPQEWTGDPVTLDVGDAATLFKTTPAVKIDGQMTALVFGEDFAVVEGSYKNNVKRGTASVTLKGLNGKLGGTKVVKFKIVSKKIK